MANVHGRDPDTTVRSCPSSSHPSLPPVSSKICQHRSHHRLCQMTVDFPDHKIVICEGGGHLLPVEQDAPLASLGPGDVLVQSKPVTIDPCDYKMHEHFPCAGDIDGCDFTGIVVAIGSQVSESGSLSIGDRVCGAIHGSNPLRPEC